MVRDRIKYHLQETDGDDLFWIHKEKPEYGEPWCWEMTVNCFFETKKEAEDTKREMLRRIKYFDD